MSGWGACFWFSRDRKGQERTDKLRGARLRYWFTGHLITAAAASLISTVCAVIHGTTYVATGLIILNMFHQQQNFPLPSKTLDDMEKLTILLGSGLQSLKAHLRSTGTYSRASVGE